MAMLREDHRAVDFDLRGLVGIRLVDASPRDVAVVTRQLGPLQRPLSRDPDIVVRFVDELPTASPLRYVSYPDAGFTDDTFLLLRSATNTPARVQVPFADVGGRCEVVCERGLPAIPLLLAVVNFTALAKGTLPLHASAVDYGGTGVLATGWSKGGKTETVLALMSEGARYVADEWTYLDPDTGQMFGVPEPIRIWSWQLRQLPGYRDAAVSRADRRRLDGLDAAHALMRRALGTRWGTSAGATAALLRRAAPVVARQSYVQLPPHELFREALGPERTRLDVVLLAQSHAAPDVTLERIDGGEVAARMLHSLAHERLPFTSYYQQFRYAFPGSGSGVVERAADLERDLLRRTLVGKDAYLLRHPYPVALPRLFDVLGPVLAGRGPT